VLEIVSVSQSPTLHKIDKVKYYIRINAYNIIVFKFLGKSSVKYLVYINMNSFLVVFFILLYVFLVHILN